MNLTLRQRTDRPDKKGECRIFLDITWAGHQLLLPSGVKCQPNHFDPGNRKGHVIHKADLQHLTKRSDLAGVVAAIGAVFKRADREADVTAEQLKAAAASANPKAPHRPVADEPAGLPATKASFAQLYDVWKQEHPGQGYDAQRRYQQVVARLDAFRPGLVLEQLNKLVFHDYLASLHDAGLADSTISHHVKFLRICHRTAEVPVPAWLKLKVKYGRAVSLRREELQALLTADLAATPYLERERERTLFQTLLLLRDSDLRRLQAHHITEQEVLGCGRVWVLEMRQKKTGDEIRLPLPPQALAIWQRWGGRVPAITQQRRNAYLKEMAQAAGLTRDFVRVRYHQGAPSEEVLPLWQVITTHTPRHTGADLVLWGSDGDQNLKEVALGHLAGASVYGYDTLERYAPLFLRAWARVLASPVFANTSGGIPHTGMVVPKPVTGMFSPVAYHKIP